MSNAPLWYDWDGEAMRVIPQHQRQADKQFVVGEKYRLGEEWERSKASHDQYFAALGDLFDSMPEAHADQAYAKSVDHLRKYALIRCGYCTIQDHVCANHAEAVRTSVIVAQCDEYAVVEVRGCIVRIFRAKSQNKRSMPKGEFQESKTRVLEWVEGLLGIQSPPIVPAEHERETA